MNIANNPSHNATVPTTIGALLTEEITIDPLSHLPSFLELTFVDVARNSGRVALSAAWDVGVVYLKGLEERLARLEQMMIFRVANLRMRSSSGRSSNLAAVKRIIVAAIARLRLHYYARLRRTCYMIAKGLQTLAPELQSLVMFAIDYHCIHYLSGSTGCEMVYGLKRSKIVNIPHNNSRKINETDTATAPRNDQKVLELSHSDKTKSALWAALLPYWKERIDKLYISLTEQPNNNERNDSNQFISSTPSSNIQNLKDVFIKLYPFIHLTHEGSIFLYQFAYLMEFTPYWSFSLHGLGVILRRITVTDIQQGSDVEMQHQQLQRQTPTTQSLQSRFQRPSHVGAPSKKHVMTLRLPRLLRGAFMFFLSYTLVSGWYRYFQRQLSLRRRRWITGGAVNAGRQSNSTTNENAQHSIPPPPQPPVLLKCAEHQGNGKWACLLCHQPRINPTASTSGYVFCYKCLILKIRRDGEYCPLTGKSCSEKEVVRLYESTIPKNS